MTFHPPAFVLPPLETVVWRSVTSATRFPQKYWPRELLERSHVRQDVAGQVMAMLADPDAFRAILADRFNDFSRSEEHDRPMRRALGSNLATVSGDDWRRQRRALSGMFVPNNLTGMAEPIQAAATACVEELLAGGEQTVSLARMTTRFALDALWRSLVDIGTGRPDPIVVRASEILVDMRAGLHETMEALKLLAKGIEAMPPAGDGPVGLRNVVSPPPGETNRLDPQELQGNVLLFMLAGHESTAATLTWALWLLATHDAVQERARAEVDRIVGADAVTANHISRLGYLDQIVNETLRLYPPGSPTVRVALAPLRVGGETLPSGAKLILNSYALHRHRRWWRDPDVFDPDRFANGSGEPTHRFAFIPFGAGPRACIGSNFAWIELIIVLATVLRSVHLTADRDSGRPPHMRIIMRPHRDMSVDIRPR